MGNPWLFDEINSYLSTGETIPRPSYAEVMRVCIDQFEKTVEYYGEGYAANSMKRHIALYLKGLPASSEIKMSIFNSKKSNQMIDILNCYKKSLENSFFETIRIAKKAG